MDTQTLVLIHVLIIISLIQVILFNSRQIPYSSTGLVFNRNPCTRVNSFCILHEPRAGSPHIILNSQLGAQFYLNRQSGTLVSFLTKIQVPGFLLNRQPGTLGSFSTGIQVTLLSQQAAWSPIFFLNKQSGILFLLNMQSGTLFLLNMQSCTLFLLNMQSGTLFLLNMQSGTLFLLNMQSGTLFLLNMQSGTLFFLDMQSGTLFLLNILSGTLFLSQQATK